MNKRNEKYLTCPLLVLSFKNLNIHFLELAENWFLETTFDITSNTLYVQHVLQ